MQLKPLSVWPVAAAHIILSAHWICSLLSLPYHLPLTLSPLQRKKKKKHSIFDVKYSFLLCYSLLLLWKKSEYTPQSSRPSSLEDFMTFETMLNCKPHLWRGGERLRSCFGKGVSLTCPDYLLPLSPPYCKKTSVCVTNFSPYQHFSYGFQTHPLQHVILNASVAPTSPRYKGFCLFVCFKEKEYPNTCCLGKRYQLLFTYGARVLRLPALSH